MNKHVQSASGLRGVRGRAVAVLVDEGLSSLQNFAILFCALHYLSLSGIGEFTLAYTTALLLESILKSLLLEPLSIRYSATDHQIRRHAASQALGASLLIGTLCFAVVALVSLPLHGAGRSIAVASGLMVPSMISQEVWRVFFFASARPWRAVVNEMWCLAGTLVLVAALVVRPHSATPAGLLLIWAGGTGIGALCGVAQTRLLPNLKQAWGWTRQNWALGSRLAGGSSAEQIGGRIALTLVGLIAGTAALGQFAAARTLIAPATTAIAASLGFAVPEAARLCKRGDPRFPGFILAMSAILAATVTLFGFAVYLAPDRVGSILAGKNWHLAKMLLLPVMLSCTVLAIRQGPRVGLRVFERPQAIIRLSAATGVAVIAATSAGAALWGAHGAAWSFALVHTAATLIWWVTYRQISRTRRVNRFPSSRTEDGPPSALKMA